VHHCGKLLEPLLTDAAHSVDGLLSIKLLAQHPIETVGFIELVNSA
jgi:hypothetical protein